MSTVCTVCDGSRTTRYKSKAHGTMQTGDCYHCGGDGQEPVIPENYGKGNSQGWCRKCTVIGGGHRTACPDR